MNPPIQKQKTYGISTLKRCIWCGDEIEAAFWQLYHPDQCPFFQRIVKSIQVSPFQFDSEGNLKVVAIPSNEKKQ